LIDTVRDRIINLPIKNSRVILKGPAGSGKSSILLERYKHMIEKYHVPSGSILILLLNRSQSLEWRKKTVLSGSGAIWRTSYYGFIQSELKMYYPIVLKKCPHIKRKELEPVFLTFETAQYLLSMVIDSKREKEAMFGGLTSSTDRISIDIAGNLVKAAISNIPHEEIGKRLYAALEKKDETKKRLYEDMDAIISDYKKRCMELGVFDFGIAVDLYNNYLFTDDEYKRHLIRRVRHLIVDNFEECVPSEVDFINFLSDHADTCLISYNPEGGFGLSFGGNIEYARSNLKSGFEEILLNESLTCSREMSEFADRLYGSIMNDASYEPEEFKCVERAPFCELRSEMLENTAERICRLINEEGYRPGDITVLSTYAEPVTEYVLARRLEKEGIGIRNLARRNRVIENPFSQALITLAHLCHPDYGILPNIDDVRDLLLMVLKIDPIRSSLLAEEICSQKPFARFPDLEFPGLTERIGYYNVEKYEYIRNWIEEYRKGGYLPINEFFQRVFLEILLTRDTNDEDALQTKKLIDSSRSFVEIVSRFGRNAGRDFLKMIRSGIKGAESIFELEEKISGDHVLLTTPVSFLASSLQSKVIILTGTSSENWYPRSIRELTNSHVLAKTWNPVNVYTEEIEEDNRKRYLATVIRAVVKKCGEKLITFESVLSANGFENEGILSEHIDRVLGRI